MFEMLAGYLEASVTPEQRRVCLDACQALTEVGIEDHAALIENELAVVDVHDGDVLINLVHGLLIPIYHNLISQYGVRLVETATLAQCVDVFKALNAIENYDDSETVYQFCESTEGSEAALADVLALIGGQTVFEYLALLEYVSPSLLERIQEIHAKEVPGDSKVSPVILRAQRRLRAILQSPLAQTGTEPLIVHYVEDGGLLGVDLRWLLKPEYCALIENMSPSQIAVEAVSFAAASNSTDESLAAVVGTILSDYLHLPMPTITQVDVSVKKLLQALHA